MNNDEFAISGTVIDRDSNYKISYKEGDRSLFFYGEWTEEGICIDRHQFPIWDVCKDPLSEFISDEQYSLILERVYQHFKDRNLEIRPLRMLYGGRSLNGQGLFIDNKYDSMLLWAIENKEIEIKKTLQNSVDEVITLLHLPNPLAWRSGEEFSELEKYRMINWLERFFFLTGKKLEFKNA